MEIISIKIEQTYVSVSHEQRENGVCYVLASQRVYLPQEVIGKDGRAKPNKLARLIHEVLAGADISTTNIAIYLGIKLAPFVAYEYKSGLSNSARAKRCAEEEDLIFYNLEERPLIAHYGYYSEYEGCENAAIIAADEDMINTLVDALDYYGYNVVMVSSALVCYAETMKSIVRGAGRVIALDLNKSGMIVVCYDKGEPILIAAREFPGVSLNANMLVSEVSRVVDLTLPKTRIVITGFLSSDQEIVSAFSSIPRVSYCQPLSYDLKGVKRNIVFRDKLAGREAMLPGVFTAIGADPTDPQIINFVKTKIKRSGGSGKGVVALCVVTLVVAFAVALYPLANLVLEELAHRKNTDMLTDGSNAEMYKKVTDKRDLSTELAELNTSVALIHGSNVSYSALIEELKIALLLDTNITNVTYTGSDGVLIDFTTSKVSNFDEMKEIVEAEGRMQIIEMIDREEVKEGNKTLTHIQIKVLAGYELQ